MPGVAGAVYQCEPALERPGKPVFRILCRQNPPNRDCTGQNPPSRALLPQLEQKPTLTPGAPRKIHGSISENRQPKRAGERLSPDVRIVADRACADAQ